jgi:hypothetical protein
VDFKLKSTVPVAESLIKSDHGHIVIPAHAGNQENSSLLDTGLRRHDGVKVFTVSLFEVEP